MSGGPPTPSAELPTDIVDTLSAYSSARLQHVARYAEALAQHKAREARLEADSEADSKTEVDEDETAERPDNLPDDVPSKTTITIKEINDNRYYHWQWRDGETVTSKCKCAVSTDR